MKATMVKNTFTKKSISLAIAFSLFAGNAAAATIEEKIELLQQEIESLKDQVESKQAGNKAGNTQSLMQNTTVGGYGEVNYNHFSGGENVKDKADARRFVLFFGHKFNDMVSVKSELELEHAIASSGDDGEIELEQMYLDFHFNDTFNAKTGLFLIPAGFLNETHEPPTFYGVERNEVETRIIPSTWREAGVAMYGEAAPGLKYQVGITTGFKASGFDDPYTAIRSAHQEGAQAQAEDLAFSAALNYTGVNGLLLGSSIFTGNTGQDESGIGDARLTLWDLHARYQVNDFDLRALYARGRLNDADDVSALTGFTAPKAFYGWFAEAAYHVWKSGDMDLAPFVRYERYDTQASLPAGAVRLAGTENKVWTIGANFYPHPQVVLKADFQHFDQDDEDVLTGENRGDKRFNLGMGYMF